MSRLKNFIDELFVQALILLYGFLLGCLEQGSTFSPRFKL